MRMPRWHVIPSRRIVQLDSGVEIFNSSVNDAHVEVTPSGELHVKPMATGQLILHFGPEA